MIKLIFKINFIVGFLAGFLCFIIVLKINSTISREKLEKCSAVIIGTLRRVLRLNSIYLPWYSLLLPFFANFALIRGVLPDAHDRLRQNLYEEHESFLHFVLKCTIKKLPKEASWISNVINEEDSI